MSLAYFDCFAGISGDMTLGALVDLGLPARRLDEMTRQLGLTGVQLTAQRVRRAGLTGVQVTVSGPPAPSPRPYQAIRAQVTAAPLPDRVRELSLRAFARLAEVEARLHGLPVEAVHFHEVGSLDALVEVVGTMVGVVELGITRAVGSPLPLGHGWASGAHGPLPLPAPATLGLLQGVPTYPSGRQEELVTPTGAAILTTLVETYGDMPALIIRGTGYGAGARDPEGHPNLLRVVVGEEQPSGREREELWLLETNIDDMNPQLYEHLIEQLFAQGALDVTLTPVIMKKGRPGVLLRVLTPLAAREPLLQAIFRESTTIGVRYSPVSRVCLPREVRTLHTRFGPVRVKYARDGQGAQQTTPEYEDCRRIAREQQLPLKLVYEEVWSRLAQEAGDQEPGR